MLLCVRDAAAPGARYVHNRSNAKNALHFQHSSRCRDNGQTLAQWHEHTQVAGWKLCTTALHGTLAGPMCGACVWVSTVSTQENKACACQETTRLVHVGHRAVHARRSLQTEFSCGNEPPVIQHGMELPLL